MEEKKTIKVMLVLHYYVEDRFVGQKLHWAEFETSGLLQVFMGCIAQGITKELLDGGGTEAYPTDSVGFHRICTELELVWRIPQDLRLNKAWNEGTDQGMARHIRVVQVTKGWEIPVANYLSAF
jgi:hypothetical protein